MHPITVLMLSPVIEDDRRREIEHRPHQLIKPELVGRQDPRPRRLRLPRFSLTSSKA